MTYIEAKKEQARLAAVGIDSKLVIAVFGKTDEEHRYSVQPIYH